MSEDLRRRLTGVLRDLEDILDELEDVRDDIPDDIAPPAPPGGKLAVVVGHTQARPGARAVAPIGEHEYVWNTDLAQRMKTHADTTGQPLAVCFRDDGGIAGAYGRAGDWGAEAVIELHFNSATPAASGTETILETDQSRDLAQAVQAAMVSTLGLRDRGVKPPWQGRGRASLTALPVPSVIVEPFFRSNAIDAATAEANKDALAAALVDAARSVLTA